MSPTSQQALCLCVAGPKTEAGIREAIRENPTLSLGAHKSKIPTAKSSSQLGNGTSPNRRKTGLSRMGGKKLRSSSNADSLHSVESVASMEKARADGSMVQPATPHSPGEASTGFKVNHSRSATPPGRPYSPSHRTHQRGFSTSSAASSLGGARPRSGVYLTGSSANDLSMMAEANNAQMELDLERFMDEMGLSEERKKFMRMLPTSQIKTILSSQKKIENNIPLTDHSKVLSATKIQHIPSARLERLKVDLRVNSITSIQEFVKQKGLSSLVKHLHQLSSKAEGNAPRRQDELNKEYNILCCIQSVLRINEGMEELYCSPNLLSQIANSIASPWVPTCTLVLKILAAVVKYKPPASTELLLQCMFTNVGADHEMQRNKEILFNKWWTRFEDIVDAFTSVPSLHSDYKSDISIVDFTVTSIVLLVLITEELPDLYLRVRIYERLHERKIHRVLLSLHSWHSGKIEDVLAQWKQLSFRDYGLVKESMASGSIAEQGSARPLKETEINTYTKYLEHFEQNQPKRRTNSDISVEHVPDAQVFINSIGAFDTPSGGNTPVASSPHAHPGNGEDYFSHDTNPFSPNRQTEFSTSQQSISENGASNSQLLLEKSSEAKFNLQASIDAVMLLNRQLISSNPFVQGETPSTDWFSKDLADIKALSENLSKEIAQLSQAISTSGSRSQ
ncbi:hypothetical protein H4219_001969 [Mycoemilia scoparia]|uniref:GBD/FH3 domain-containing protein n=1 Tax=Mycoemilia scoparia TaxID=417184 RepID=A0A9W7ZZP3_9FUNG|nr:hypothetical protein H4219_001969 [Mycoemilia scoparia]